MGLNCEALIESNVQLVHRIACRRFPDRLPNDDLLQVGLIGLWEAAANWNGRGNFKAYASTCIYHNMVDYIRESTGRHETINSAAMIRDEEARPIDEEIDEGISRELAAVLGEQSEEYKILVTIASGCKITAAAALNGLDVCEFIAAAKKAYRRFQRLREQKETTGD